MLEPLSPEDCSAFRQLPSQRVEVEQSCMCSLHLLTEGRVAAVLSGPSLWCHCCEQYGGGQQLVLLPAIITQKINYKKGYEIQ